MSKETGGDSGAISIDVAELEMESRARLNTACVLAEKVQSAMDAGRVGIVRAFSPSVIEEVAAYAKAQRLLKALRG